MEKYLTLRTKLELLADQYCAAYGGDDYEGLAALGEHLLLIANIKGRENGSNTSWPSLLLELKRRSG